MREMGRERTEYTCQSATTRRVFHNPRSKLIVNEKVSREWLEMIKPKARLLGAARA